MQKKIIAFPFQLLHHTKSKVDTIFEDCQNSNEIN